MSRSALVAGIRQFRSIVTARHHRADSDEQLLHSFVVGRDESAFTTLVYRYGPMVGGVCRRVLGHPQDAEDAFQATFLVLARNAAALRKKTALASFLYGTAYRIALSAKRTAARRRKHESQVPARPSINPVDELSWREVRALVDEEIARLPEKYRSAFILCCLESVSQAEAARRLGLKEGTLSSRLTAARKLLSQRLTRRGVELSAVLATSTLAASSASALPPMLVASTIQAAMATALGAGTTGLVSAHVAGLVKSAAVSAVVSKFKMAAAVLLAITVLAGAGVWISSAGQVPIAAETLPAPSASKQQPLQANHAETPSRMQSDIVTVKGRVLGPDGKPVKGARLYSARLPQRFPAEDAMVELAQAKPTDTTGRFDIQIRKPASDFQSYLVAYAPGLGLDWINLGEDNWEPEATLRLVKDVPITGRVVNTEGRPVAGVTVSLATIGVPKNETLDTSLKGWDSVGSSRFRDAFISPTKLLRAPLDAICGTATTDKDGRFLVHGVGGERIAHVSFSGAGVARTTPFVLTWPGFDVKPYNAILQKDQEGRRFVETSRFRMYSPEFTFVAEPGKTIEGVVKDTATGKPVANCIVRTQTSFTHGIAVFTNSEGKYRLEGLAKRSQGHYLFVNPPNRSAYLSRRVSQMADTVGFTTIRCDIELAKGAIVTGRVVEKGTGKGVRCSILFWALPDNKYVNSTPGFDPSLSALSQIEAGEDGRFRIVSLPGEVLLTARVYESMKLDGKRLSTYRQAVPDPDHKDLFRPAPAYDSWSVTTAGNRLTALFIENAVKVIDVQKDGETKVELFVDRGTTARIAVQDGEGKPLPGTWVAGLADVWPSTYQLPEATATVYALNPDKPRKLAFVHPEKKLGGMAVVRGDEKDPVVVKLAPVGSVAGRLLDGEGNPLEGVEVSIFARTEPARGLYRFAEPAGKPARTDKDGRFLIKGVVPGLKFTMILRKGGASYVGEQGIIEKQIKAGETLDLGSVRTKPR